MLPEDSGVTTEAIDERRSLLQLGLDSMLLEQFKSTLEADHSVELDIEMLFQNVTTLEVIVELILSPGVTLKKLRAEVEKNRTEEPAEAQSGDEAPAASPTSEKISPEPRNSATAEGPPKPKYVDADEAEDRHQQSSSPCSNSGCTVS